MVENRSRNERNEPSHHSRNFAKRLLAVMVTLAVVIGLVWSIKRLGEAARREIASHDRYVVQFADIESNLPPGLDRAEFLAEVRYISGFPESFQSIDGELAARLGEAFGAHPWVAAFEGVSVDQPGIVRVSLRFRVRALAVRIDGGDVRVVDTAGVLLPQNAPHAGLPELATPVPRPASPVGQPWPDDTVKRAVELVEAYHPQRLEKSVTGWKLTLADGQTVLVDQ
jgi:hypothetical protein